MKLISFSSIVFLVVLVFSFSSCGNGNSKEGSTDSSESQETSSNLDNYQEKPCELLTEGIIRKYITTSYEIRSESKINQSLPRGASSCKYAWRKSEGNDSDYFIDITMMDYEKNKAYFSLEGEELVEGIGDGAYFRFVTPNSCTLLIRSANKIIMMNVTTDDEDNQKNIEIAKRIAKEIL